MSEMKGLKKGGVLSDGRVGLASDEFQYIESHHCASECPPGSKIKIIQLHTHRYKLSRIKFHSFC